MFIAMNILYIFLISFFQIRINEIKRVLIVVSERVDRYVTKEIQQMSKEGRMTYMGGSIELNYLLLKCRQQRSAKIVLVSSRLIQLLFLYFLSTLWFY